MRLLDVHGDLTGHAQAVIAERRHFAAALSGEPDGRDSHSTALLKGAHDVGRVAGGGNGEEDVSRLAKSFNLAGEEALETIVVGDGGEDGGVRGECDGTHGGAIVDETANELRGNVLGVGCAAAVAGD